YAGYLTNDTTSSMIAVVLTTVRHPRPVMTSVFQQSATNLVISGTNGFPNAPFYVVASTNVSLPLTNWDPISSQSFDANGNFSFSAPIIPSIPNRFYAVQVQ